MTIKRGTTGTGITQKPTYKWDDDAEEAEPEIAAILETGTLDGLLASVERECFAIMGEAGLPTYHGCYSYNRDGEWQGSSPDLFFRGWGIANEIWPIVKARGISEDSLIGFASRMLGDVVWLRRAREKGDHDRAAHMAFYLGVKRAELRIKSEHERVWQTGKKIHGGGDAARRGEQAGRVAAVDALCTGPERIKKTAAFAVVAEREGVTAKAIETDYYKARKHPKPGD